MSIPKTVCLKLLIKDLIVAIRLWILSTLYQYDYYHTIVINASQFIKNHCRLKLLKGAMLFVQFFRPILVLGLFRF